MIKTKFLDSVIFWIITVIEITLYSKIRKKSHNNCTAVLLDKYKKSIINIMTNSTAIVIAGIIVGVVAISGIMVYATANQQNFLQEGSELAPAAKQGSFASPSGLGADLNKEQWHEDPYADEAAKVKAEFYKNNEG